MKISKIEGIVITFFILFSVVWMIFLMPFLQGLQWFYELSPLYAYWIYNIGWIFGLVAILGYPVSYFIEKESNVISLLRGGFASWFVVSWIFDLAQAPFFLSPSGQVLVSLGTPSLTNTSVDAFWATVWGNVVSGPMLYIFTYLVTPCIAIILVALLLSPKTFIGLIVKK